MDCCSLAGFFLVQYSHFWQQHLDKLFDLFSKGKLKVGIDPKRFSGLHSVADAVEYLHSGKSVGKVVVCMIQPILNKWRNYEENAVNWPFADMEFYLDLSNYLADAVCSFF